MVKQHYRWDFYGLSTDVKPTPETSERVVDGSTFYCSDTSKLYVFCKDTWYEKTVSGGGTSDFNDLTNKPKYNGTAMSGETDIPVVPSVVQSTGTSTTDVMSQSATTEMVFADPSTRNKVQIGSNSMAQGQFSCAIANSYARGQSSLAIGVQSSTVGSGSEGKGSVAIGSGAIATAQGEFNIGSNYNTDYGYNNSNYRLISGVYDGQSAHDAATKGQLDSIAIKNAGAPTTATVGTVGQLLEDTTNGKLYICTAVTPGTDPDPDTYTWVEVGAGGGSGVTELTSADYDYPDANPREVALWRLPGGLYKVDGSTVVAFNSFTQDVTPTDGATFLVLPNPDPNTPSRSRTLIIRQDLVEPTFYSVYRETGSNYSFGSLGVYVAQNTGTSTDAVMSQNATTSMVFADPSTKYQVRIGGDATIIGHAVAIGGSSYARTNGVALGVSAKANDDGIAFAGCETNAKGVMQVGPNRAGWDTSGYNNSAYRLISGVYDGQSNHDAATVAQGNKLMTTAPATTDAGVLGQLWTDTTAMHTYQLTAIDTTDPDNPVYTWTQRW